MLSCGEFLVAQLEARGVDTVFGIPGNHTVQLYRGLAGSTIRHVSPRHEQGAGFMADGYARATGRPGVCFLISGPGLTNAMTPMMQALADSVPMLVITAVAARHQLGMGEGHLHELPDQRALASQCSRFSHTLMRPDELPRVLARAFAVFESERPGPVHIELPLDVITADASGVPAQLWPVSPPPSACPQSLQDAAVVLSGSRAPALLVGGGAVAASQQVQLLAESLDAPVFNTVNAKGVLSCEHPLSVGGSPSLAAVREHLAQADVVLAVGTEFGETDYDMLFLGDLEVPAKLLRIDIDARQLCRNIRADTPLCGDARASLNVLLQELSPRVAGDGESRAQRARESIQRDAHFHPQMQAFFETVQEALPGLILVGDSTLPTYYAVWQYEAREPRCYFHSATGGGTLGYAIPAALGARLAHPERPVACLIGDGSAQFTLMELAAGVDERLPVAVMVWNNAGYREIKAGMLASGVEPVGVDIRPPDLCAAARALGCATAAPANLAELAGALRESTLASVPTLIDIDQSLFISEPAGQWY